MSFRSVVRSAISPPDLLELDDELVDGLRRGLLGLLAAVDELGGRADPAAVAGEGRGGAQHLGGDAGGGELARSVNRAATVSAAALKRSTSAGRASSAT
jgi:hypothetical protein